MNRGTALPAAPEKAVISGRVECACGVRHFPAQAWAHRGCVVVHAPMVVHAEAEAVVHSRHGVYADAEARKAYQRQWMRKDRAAKAAKA